MGYTKDAIKGISWLGAFRVLTRIISLARTAILARILSPNQFGTFGIAAIVLSFLEILTETGINILLVQRKDDIKEYIDTAWIVSIVRGFLISLLILLLSPVVSSFFNSSESFSLLMLIALVPIIRGFINPSVSRFVKDLEFNREFYYRSSVFLVESIVTVIVCLLSRSAEGLVWGLIIGALFEVVITFYFIKPTPAFRFDTMIFKTIISKGKWLTATGIFNYLYHNADNMVVGKLLGTSSLGLYDMAYRISTLPISEVSDVIGKATFPVYVKISEDLDRLKTAYIKSVILIVFLVVPMGLMLFFMPELIISVLLGDQWLAASSVLKILAVFGVIRAISISVLAPFYALEKQKVITVITLISLIGMGSTIIPFISNFGLDGAAYSVLVGTLVSLPATLYYANDLLTSKRHGSFSQTK